MQEISRTSVSSFTLFSKGRAFCKGLISGQPLVEVAKTGLKREIPDELQIKYAKRIRERGSASEACEILSHGITSHTAEDILAEIVKEKGGEEDSLKILIGNLISSENAQSILAENVKSGLFAYILLKCGTITSHDAQEKLAQTLKDSGLSERAVDLLFGGGITSMTAQMHISQIIPYDAKVISNLIVYGNVPIEVMAELSKRMPPVCRPIKDE